MCPANRPKWLYFRTEPAPAPHPSCIGSRPGPRGATRNFRWGAGVGDFLPYRWAREIGKKETSHGWYGLTLPLRWLCLWHLRVLLSRGRAPSASGFHEWDGRGSAVSLCLLWKNWTCMRVGGGTMLHCRLYCVLFSFDWLISKSAPPVPSWCEWRSGYLPQKECRCAEARLHPCFLPPRSGKPWRHDCSIFLKRDDRFN